MNSFNDLLAITIPALLVLAAAVLIMRSFVKQEQQRRAAREKSENNKTTLPLRLQAYERLLLLLERIGPTSLVMRHNDSGSSSLQMQRAIIHSIREEFEHNLAQQLYVSDELWVLIKNAKESINSFINEEAARVGVDSESAELAMAILSNSNHHINEIVDTAKKYLKREAQDLF